MEGSGSGPDLSVQTITGTTPDLGGPKTYGSETGSGTLISDCYSTVRYRPAYGILLVFFTLRLFHIRQRERHGTGTGTFLVILVNGDRGSILWIVPCRLFRIRRQVRS